MIQTRTHTERVVNVDNTSHNKPGGYKMYFKLYLKLLEQMKANKNLFSKPHYAWICFMVYLKFIWWCGIKPLGQFFTTSVNIMGQYKIINGVFENVSVMKVTSKKFMGMIFLEYASKLTDEDIENLKK
jgi:hypothetical protein